MFNFLKKSKVTEHVPVQGNHQSAIVNFDNIEQLADYFKTLTGVTFETQKTILKSKLISFCRTHDISSFHQCLQEIKSNTATRQALVNYLTTNESYFYRELDQIMDLVQKVKQAQQTVSILCAPSSTGEETYSIVMALFEANVPKNQFNIVGIDVNTEAIELAHLGIYNTRNVSKLPEPMIKQYFDYRDTKYYLKDQIKSCVSFRPENIFSPSFTKLGKFDYIFSRNMLIYFDQETKLKAKKILEDRLKDCNKPIYFGHADLF